MENIRVRAQKANQGTLPFYIFLITSDDLAYISYVVRRSEDQKEGIQRIATPERVSEIASFINESIDVIFPNNLIINFDKTVIFRPDEDRPEEGELIIPRKKHIAQIIDGQHRLFGLEAAKKKINIIVVAFSELDLAQRAKLFLTINSKQKGINTSLIYDLFGITRTGKTVELLAVDIAKSLNTDEDSPFKGMIKLTDARKKEKESLSLAACVTALKKILKNKDVPFSSLDYQQQVVVLKNYFSSIKQLFALQWGARGHVLTKTLGFNALMRVFPKVHLRCILKQDLLCKNVKIDIDNWENFDFRGSSWEGVSGEAGATRVANVLEEKLTKLS